MSPEALIETLTVPPLIDCDRLPDMFDLPSEYPEDPGLPDLFHYHQPTLLSETFRVTGDSFTVGDMCIYFDPKNPRQYRRPDWFAVMGVDSLYKGHMRKSYVLWQEKVRPFVVIELLSFSTMDEDYGISDSRGSAHRTKLDIYRDTIQVPYYIVFDGEEVRNTMALHLEDGRYRRMTSVIDDVVRVPIPEIGLELRSWVGHYGGFEYCWLRWFTLDGVMIATHEEENRRLRARLRAAGLDPEG